MLLTWLGSHELLAEVSATLASLEVRTWLPSLLAVPVGIACATMSWQVFVDDLGTPVGPARGGQIFLVGQLGTYVPGSVWAYILQLELGRRAGVARARVFTANVFSLAVAVVAALTVGSLAIPAVTHANPGLERLRWLYVLLPLGIIGLHPRVLSSAAGRGFRVLGRPSQDHRIRKRTVAGSLGWALASYVFFGVRACTHAAESYLRLAGEREKGVGFRSDMDLQLDRKSVV